MCKICVQANRTIPTESELAESSEIKMEHINSCFKMLKTASKKKRAEERAREWQKQDAFIVVFYMTINRSGKDNSHNRIDYRT